MGTWRQHRFQRAIHCHGIHTLQHLSRRCVRSWVDKPERHRLLQKSGQRFEDRNDHLAGRQPSLAILYVTTPDAFSPSLH